jgi:hypothetical protein
MTEPIRSGVYSTILKRIVFFQPWRCRHGLTSSQPCEACGRSVAHKEG